MYDHMAREASRHSGRALLLFKEANELLREGENAYSTKEHLDLMERVIQKDNEAIAETEEAIRCQNEFVSLQKEFLASLLITRST